MSGLRKRRSYGSHCRCWIGGGCFERGVVVVRLRFFADNGKPNGCYTDASARCTKLNIHHILVNIVLYAQSYQRQPSMRKATRIESEILSRARRTVGTVLMLKRCHAPTESL